MSKKKKKKVIGRISISMDKVTIKWLDTQVKAKRFGSRSHGVEVGLKMLRKKIEAGEVLNFD